MGNVRASGFNPEARRAFGCHLFARRCIIFLMNEQPLALFLTWTTYGTWLPGDSRGYVSNTLQPDGTFQFRHNHVGKPFDRDDVRTLRYAKLLQRDPTTWLTPAQSLVAAESMVEASLKRGWRIIRGAVMTNHVHVVVSEVPIDGPSVRRVLKGVSQRRLTERTNAGKSRRWWTAGGCDRVLRDDLSMENAVQYVEYQKCILAQIVENVASSVTQ